MPISLDGMSAVVQVFGRRHDEPFHALLRERAKVNEAARATRAT
jgi:hypothetical protein